MNHSRRRYSKSRISTGTQIDDTDPVELVSFVRSEPTDVRDEYLLRRTTRLCQGGSAYLPRDERIQFHRSARGSYAVTVTPIWEDPLCGAAFYITNLLLVGDGPLSSINAR